MNYIQLRTIHGEVRTVSATTLVQVTDPHPVFCGCDYSGCLRCLGLMAVEVGTLEKGDTCVIPLSWIGGGTSAKVMGPASTYLGHPITHCPPGGAIGASPW